MACLAAALLGQAPNKLTENQGWVLIAFQNAFQHLAAGRPIEDALIETVGAGGDTDTNAAICGALLGVLRDVRQFRHAGARRCSPADHSKRAAPVTRDPIVTGLTMFRLWPRRYWVGDKHRAPQLARLIHVRADF
jgi:hypothetical protein